MDINECRSYATATNLQSALTKLGFDSHRHVVVRNAEGRWTAIFPASNVQGDHAPVERRGDLMHCARHGFMTIG